MDIQHRFAVPITQPRMHFFAKDGKPLVGGKVYSFKVGTDEFKPTYRNSEQTSLNQNPIVLDNAGSALIYLKGSHLLRVYDKNNVLIQEIILPLQKMRSQFFDDIGRPLSYGKVYTFDYQSTLRKKSYANADEAQLNPNPVILDEFGWASISIVGAYRLRSHDKNGVFIRDQDFKGLPVKALTSWVYPLYFEESVATDFELNDSILKEAITTEIENISTSFSINSVSFRTLLNETQIDPDSVNTSFIFNGVQITQKVAYISTKLDIESLKTGFSVNSIQITKFVNFVNNTMEIESLKTGFSVNFVQITN